jgi:hypothetical protein
MLVAEVLVRLVQGDYHTGQAVVEGQVRRVRNHALGQPVRRTTSQPRGLRTTRQLTGPA